MQETNFKFLGISLIVCLMWGFWSVQSLHAQAKADTTLIGSSTDSTLKLNRCFYSSNNLGTADSIIYFIVEKKKFIRVGDLGLNLEVNYSQILLEKVKLDRKTDGILLKHFTEKSHSVGQESWGLETKRIQIINLYSAKKIFDTYIFYKYQFPESEVRYYFNFCYCDEGLIKIEEIDLAIPLPTEGIDSIDDPLFRLMAQTGVGTFIFKNGTFIKKN